MDAFRLKTTSSASGVNSDDVKGLKDILVSPDIFWMFILSRRMSG